MNVRVEFTPEEVTKALYDNAINRGLLTDSNDIDENNFDLFDEENSKIEKPLNIWTQELPI